jgi:peptidoglycan/LPS O-acetylase OafA/YrhL
VAIVAVIASHTGYAAFGSGFYGVDGFFVLSGFLITTLLLEERAGTGAVSLRLFWQRRAARLLPALAVLCVAMLAITALNAIVSLRPTLSPYPAGQTLLGIATAATYTASWAQALFHAQLGPLVHTWSLSVEEWFYVLWPLALLALVRRPTRLAGAVTAIAAAAIAYRLLSEELISSRRYLYFAVDQRACQLLVGCALGAVLVVHGERLARHPRVVGWLGALGAAGFAVLMARPLGKGAVSAGVPYERFLEPVAALAMLPVIACLVTRPGFWLARLLALRPLVWLGRRSYGLYLYHYPILLLVSPWGPTGVMPHRTLAISIVLMLVAAAASYRWVERPVIGWMRRREADARRAGHAPAVGAPRAVPRPVVEAG